MYQIRYKDRLAKYESCEESRFLPLLNSYSGNHYGIAVSVFDPADLWYIAGKRWKRIDKLSIRQKNELKKRGLLK